jgi:hypothetical protein
MLRSAAVHGCTAAGTRSRVLRVAGLAGLALLAWSLSLAAPDSWLRDAEAKRVQGKILYPHAGQTVPARPLTIRLHTGSNPPHNLRAWLNGRPIHRHFSRASRRGVRKLKATPSHGLKHGSNRLQIRIKRRGREKRVAAVRFRVRRNRPLAAAGVDRRHAAGSRVFLDGRRSLLHPRARRAGSRGRQFGHGGLRYRWRVVDAPRGSSLRGAGSRGFADAGSEGATTPTPSITPDLPGSYRVQLTTTAYDGQSGSTVVQIAADPSPALPVDTMAEEGGKLGIRVGTGPGSFYPAEDNAWAQMVALRRAPTSDDPVLKGTNKSYPCPFSQVNPSEDPRLLQCVNQLRSDLQALNKSYLVIVANQPWQARYADTQQPYMLERALGPIGVAPTEFSNPPWCAPCDLGRGVPPGLRLTGSISAIGVPGSPQGEGDWHAVPEPDDGTGQGQMTGWLIRNNAKNYTYESDERVDFDTQAEGTTESQNVIRVGQRTFPQAFPGGIRDGGGFQVVVLDPRTLEGASHWFETDHSDLNALRGQVTAMRDLIQGVNAQPGPDRDLVFITSLGMPAIQYYRRTGVNPNDGLNTELAQLVNEVEKLGGTRNGFYKALDPDLYGTHGYSYTLFAEGNSGAGHGNERIGTGISGTGAGPLNTARLAGNLARTGPNYGFELQGSLRAGPLATTTTARDPSRASAELMRVAFQPPQPWPEQGNPGRTAAIQWIGQQVLSTTDPRGQYYTRALVNQQFDYSGWEQDAYRIQGLKYPTQPPPDPCTPAQTDIRFCPADLEWAKTQLAGPLQNPPVVGGEILWLTKTHKYLDSLATPFSDQGLQSWAKLQSLVDEVNTKVKADRGAQITATRYKALFEFAAKLAEEIPGVGKAFTVANDTYELAGELAETGGEPTETEFQSVAAEVGQKLATRLGDAQTILTRQLPNIIAADYGKLMAVGACAAFDQSKCPYDARDWQYTGDDQIDASKALGQGTSAWAYGELLPAKYTLFQLPQWWKRKVDNQFHSRDLAADYPFGKLPDSAQYAKPIYRNIPYYSHENHADGYLEWTMTGGSDRWQIYALGHLDGAGSTFSPWAMQTPDASVTDKIFGAPPGGLGLDPETFFERQFDRPEETQALDHYPTKGTTIGWCELQFSCD